MGRPHMEPLVDRDVEARSLALPGFSSGITYRTDNGIINGPRTINDTI